MADESNRFGYNLKANSENQFGYPLEKREQERTRELHGSDLLPGIVEQRHIQAPFYLIYIGDSTDLPDDGSTEIKAFFAKDESKLYIWNATNSAWESTTLS